ncbi:hypothetical protein [Methylocella sp.]|uniref:hypothetical protein n=1 Tax=Methylocella sp. TaxID=1978226 RepID=UPI0037832932
MTKEEEREALILFLALAEPQMLPKDDELFKRAQEKEKNRRGDDESTLYEDLGKVIEHVKKGSLCIKVDEKTLRESFRATIERRLSALLKVYACDATPDGWKKLALALAMKATLDGVPLMEIRVPPMERDARGRSKSPVHPEWFQKMESYISQTGKTATEAAYHLTGFKPGTNYKYNKKAEIDGIKPNSLEALYSRMKNKNQNIDRAYFGSIGFKFLLSKDMRAAVDNLEASDAEQRAARESRGKRGTMTLASIKRIKGRSPADRLTQKHSKGVLTIYR